ncbi:hypothetical protein NAEGRDRAFT_80841 [Naegleria gruberi]|uniref:PPPDE domain-containing protein n=1 Tax=Naegleria gruberi TaxID=5762 RepID=D2VQ24_NAEGR|nr:uncharacterized protein NAEGRDRAFT_80841 [Naegleria gruberi]EFC41105.1 hypothetical protein NAEGRDRAFT_80841 [Naegleria gruberi]|eukprot:XP_002673849.1 hypothetical protein NAEGRDRAFT_80841 [Naegleria gruberi strain NEG-M]
MGNYFSQDSLESFNVGKGSDSANSVPTRAITDKPINNCDNNDLINLMREFKYQNSLIEKLLINNTMFHGHVFKDLAKAIVTGDRSTIDDEKQYIIARLSKLYDVDQGSMSSFVDSVVEAKIRKDIENGSGRKNTFAAMEQRYNPAYQFDSVPTTGTQSDIGTNSNNVHLPSDDSDFDSRTPFDEEKLNDWEKQGIEHCKKNLSEYYKTLNERGKSFKSANLTGDLDLDAQNLTCKDRFLYNTFCSRILANPNRRKMEKPPYVAVKLVISELQGNNFIRSVLSKIVTTEFGILHTGIMIGEWKFDWYNNSLISVRTDKNIESSNSIAVIDLGFLRTKNQIMDAFLKITDICCTFNAKKTYSQLDCNCQHFVSQVLDALSLSRPSGKTFDNYFSDLKKGNTSRKFYYTETLKAFIQNLDYENEFTKLDTMIFENRKTLDEFCHWLNSIGYFETDAGEGDYKLLKAFDRSFCIAGDAEGSTIVDYSSYSGVKDNSFFSKNGDRYETTIHKIEYNVQDLDFTPHIPNR